VLWLGDSGLCGPIEALCLFVSPHAYGLTCACAILQAELELKRKQQAGLNEQASKKARTEAKEVGLIPSPAEACVTQGFCALSAASLVCTAPGFVSLSMGTSPIALARPAWYALAVAWTCVVRGSLQLSLARVLWMRLPALMPAL